MVEKEKEEKYGVYLNLKTRKRYKSGIFDYSSNVNDNKIINTFITKEIYLKKDKYNDIKGYENKKAENENENDSLILTLFNNKINNNKFYIDNLTFTENTNSPLDINEKNIKLLNTFIWKVINSDSIDDNNPNDDYFLRENDIIKFGDIKYIVKEIHIENKEKENKQNQILNLIPTCSEHKICEYCNEEIYRLCECNEYQHFDCIQKWIDGNKRVENNRKTVINYIFNIFECKELIDKDRNCSGDGCKYCKCKYCNTYYPLKFKLSNENKIIDFYRIEKPENSNYLILESLEYLNKYKRLEKNIHIIKLNGEDINIGSGNNNDIIIDDKTVSKEHAVIKYDKENNKLCLKNKNKKAGTLVLIQESNIEINENGIYLQVDNTFIEAKIMN